MNECDAVHDSECDETLENKGSNEITAACKTLNNDERTQLAQLLSAANTDSDDKTTVSVSTVRGISRCDGNDGARDAGAVMLMPLQHAGITPARLATALHDGLNARKHVVVDRKVKRVPDWAVRIKYLELAHKLRGDFPATSKDSSVQVSYEERLMTVMQKVKDKVLDISKV